MASCSRSALGFRSRGNLLKSRDSPPCRSRGRQRNRERVAANCRRSDCLTEVKRAARALQQAGVKIARVTIEGGKVEFITTDGDPEPKATVETSEDVKKLL